jgi:hypothetical protein
MGALERGYKRREPRALGFVPFAATAGGNTPRNTEADKTDRKREREQGGEGGGEEKEDATGVKPRHRGSARHCYQCIMAPPQHGTDTLPSPSIAR